MRRDAPPAAPEVRELGRATEARDSVFTTGLVLQELLQGFSKPKAQDQIIERFRGFADVDAREKGPYPGSGASQYLSAQWRAGRHHRRTARSDVYSLWAGHLDYR